MYNAYYKNLFQVRICRSFDPPSPPRPSHNCSYFHERCAQCWIAWKINFTIFIFWVMVDCIYNFRWHIWIFNYVTDKKISFKSGQIYMKNAQYAEWKKNQISDFCDFSILLLTKIFFVVQKWPHLYERWAMCWNEWKMNFPIFSFWDMVDFVLKFV